MREVYRAANITEAHIVAGMLEAEGIETHVGGHYLQGGVGELAPLDLARVFVADVQFDRALAHVRTYTGEPVDDLERGPEHGVPDGSRMARPVSASGAATAWVAVSVVFVVIGVFALISML
ncbi:MAG: DUF2007 domain-containing protein [Gammaproteobacteria bacterium]